ncbi:T9SS type A sorting domain-containing protein [Flectobacillus major]|uniref:T9SS type A sorting domain-containing protein n=1 Tax=Flectobacillus major TaxID=103 RepID=UPI0004180DCF|nr:T9SS type A sorting domain-containing protein [Flectobacillus major]
MFFLRRLTGFICMMLLGLPIFGQFKITSPLSRAVYQRNQSGVSTISVTGTYEQQVDRIEARLIPIASGQGDAGTWSDWKTLQDLPLNGNFASTMTINQGWYKLEIRGVLNNTVVGSVASIDRVGVGEVFIIAGQSNAEGLYNSSQKAATDDRVNVFANGNDVINGGNDYATLSPFSRLDVNTTIAPRGKGAYCWGVLGDLLAQKLNVPILFLNVGFNGTSVETWSVTSQGGSAYNIYLGGYYPNGLPYSNMKSVLNYFVPLLGVRSVLWCQGEADNVPFKTSRSDYKARLQTVINKTREHSGKNISWMVSLTSASTPPTSCNPANVSESWNEVLEGQKAVISETSNVFTGPSTDGIQNPGRSECLHFWGDGLVQLAQAWNSALTTTFFQNSQPQAPTLLPSVSYACSDNKVDVTLPSGYSQYQWSNSVNFNSAIFSGERIASLNSGTYYARLLDSRGNVIQLPPIIIRTTMPQTASVSPSGNVGVCINDGLTLSANSGVIYRWNNGSTTQNIRVNQAGSFSVQVVDNYGCLSTLASPVTTFLKNTPAVPTISANGPLEFCADSRVTLSSSGQSGYSYLWSSGATTASVQVNQSGSFKVKTINTEGCSSLESAATVVIVNPLPATPSIVPNGPTTICSDTSVVLQSSNISAVSYRWNTGAVARNIRVTQAGNYTVQTIDSKGCVSLTSSPLSVKVNQIPITPTVLSTKDTVFCDGENTVLQMSLVGNNLPTWVVVQNGITSRYPLQSLNVNVSGSFRAIQTDQNNCNSSASPVVYVSVKPNPDKVVLDDIIRVSPYTLGINNKRADQYIWELNGSNLTATTSEIKFSETGDVRVTARKVYTTQFYGSKSCLSPISDKKYFSLYDDTGLSIYPNPSNGQFTLDTRFVWTNTQIEVYNNAGALVYTGTMPAFDTRKTIDLTDLPIGGYLLRVKADNFTSTKRIEILR